MRNIEYKTNTYQWGVETLCLVCYPFPLVVVEVDPEVEEKLTFGFEAEETSLPEEEKAFHPEEGELEAFLPEEEEAFLPEEEDAHH